MSKYVEYRVYSICHCHGELEEYYETHQEACAKVTKIMNEHPVGTGSIKIGMYGRTEEPLEEFERTLKDDIKLE